MLEVQWQHILKKNRRVVQVCMHQFLECRAVAKHKGVHAPYDLSEFQPIYDPEGVPGSVPTYETIAGRRRQDLIQLDEEGWHFLQLLEAGHHFCCFSRFVALPK